MPVHDGDQVDEALGQRNVGNVAAPDLVSAVDRQAAQQVRVLGVLGRRLAGIGALVDRYQTHQPHQALHPLAVHRVPLRGQACRHAARAVEGPRQVLAVDQLHQPEIVRADRSRAAVDRGPADLQQVALPADGQSGMRAVDHRTTLGPASLPSLLAKKSFSTFSWPIWRYSSPTWVSLVLSSRSLPFSNTPAAPSSSAFFQAWIWLGWTLNSPASSPTVRSPLSAAKATFALNVALCFCRDCFMTAPLSGPFIEAGLSHRHLSQIRGPSHSSTLVWKVSHARICVPPSVRINPIGKFISSVMLRSPSACR